MGRVSEPRRESAASGRRESEPASRNGEHEAAGKPLDARQQQARRTSGATVANAAMYDLLMGLVATMMSRLSTSRLMRSSRPHEYASRNTASSIAITIGFCSAHKTGQFGCTGLGKMQTANMDGWKSRHTHLRGEERHEREQQRLRVRVARGAVQRARQRRLFQVQAQQFVQHRGQHVLQRRNTANGKRR
jgi:hypothetical protein